MGLPQRIIIEADVGQSLGCAGRIIGSPPQRHRFFVGGNRRRIVTAVTCGLSQRNQGLDFSCVITGRARQAQGFFIGRDSLGIGFLVALQVAGRDGDGTGIGRVVSFFCQGNGFSVVLAGAGRITGIGIIQPHKGKPFGCGTQVITLTPQDNSGFIRLV